jgi:hypothetical protein
MHRLGLDAYELTVLKQCSESVYAMLRRVARRQGKEAKMQKAPAVECTHTVMLLDVCDASVNCHVNPCV